MSSKKCPKKNRFIYKNDLQIVNGHVEIGKEILYLVGLLEVSQKTSHEGGLITGKILFMDCNQSFYQFPLAAAGTQDENKISVDNIPLTSYQLKEIRKRCKDAEGTVHLYVGEFSMGKCQVSSGCTVLRGYDNLSLLSLLCDNRSCKYFAMMDLQSSMPLTSEQLKNVARLRIERSRCGQGTQGAMSKLPCYGRFIQEKKVGGGENMIRFWMINELYLVVDLVCNERHSDYSVVVELTETFACDHMSYGPKPSRTLVQEQVSVKSTISQYSRCFGKCNPKRVSIPVVLMPIPEYNTVKDLSILEQWHALEIAYDCKVQLTEYSNPCHKPTRKKQDELNSTSNVWKRKVLRRRNSFPPSSTHARNHPASFPGAPKSTIVFPPIPMIQQNLQCDTFAECSNFHGSLCAFPVNINVKKVHFIDREKTSATIGKQTEMFGDDDGEFMQSTSSTLQML